MGPLFSRLRDLARALGRISRARKLLRGVGFHACLRRLDGDRRAPIGTGSDERVEALAAAMRVAARLHPRRPQCLVRSLALWSLLRDQGCPAMLRIGTRLHAGTLRAHAWVELDGQVINDSQYVAEIFQAFDGLGPKVMDSLEHGLP